MRNFFAIFILCSVAAHAELSTNECTDCLNNVPVARHHVSVVGMYDESQRIAVDNWDDGVTNGSGDPAQITLAICSRKQAKTGPYIRLNPRQCPELAVSLTDVGDSFTGTVQYHYGRSDSWIYLLAAVTDTLAIDQPYVLLEETRMTGIRCDGNPQ
jgi:hypothetical protein